MPISGAGRKATSLDAVASPRAISFTLTRPKSIIVKVLSRGTVKHRESPLAEWFKGAFRIQGSVLLKFAHDFLT